MVFTKMLRKLLIVVAIITDVYGLDFKQVSYQIAELCENNKTPEKTSELQISIINFTNCLQDKSEDDTLLARLGNSNIMTRGKYEDIIRTACSKSLVTTCMNDLIQDFSPCMPPGVSLYVNKTIHKFLEFACENKGENIISFFHDGGLDCMSASFWKENDCMSTIKTINNTKLTQKDFCEFEDQIAKCLKPALKSCSSSTPAAWLHKLHQKIQCNAQDRQTTVAEDVQNEDATTTTGSSVISDDVMDQLKIRKLQLEIRAAELEIWHKENQLKVQHTVLTSDVKRN